MEKKGNKGTKEGVQRLVKEIGVVGKVKDVRGIGGKNKEGKEMVWLKMGSEEEPGIYRFFCPSIQRRS